jgi:hypothetical protein
MAIPSICNLRMHHASVLRDPLYTAPKLTIIKDELSTVIASPKVLFSEEPKW